MKRIVAVLVTLSLINFLPSASAAVKAGTTCKVKNSSQIYSGKKFTCVLKNKKLVWDSGKKVPVVNKPTPVSTTEPVLTPEPVAVDTKWYPWGFRYNDAGILERSQNAAGVWSSSPTRPGQVIDPIRVKAFSEITKFTNPSTRTAVDVRFFFSPNLKAGVEAAYRKYFDASIAFFEAQIPKGTTLDVVVGTELDDAFFQESFLKSLGNASEAAELLQRNRSMIHQFDGAEGKNSSGGGTVGGTSKAGHFLFIGAVCSCAQAENLLMYNVAHETTHFYQFAATPTTPKQNFIGNWPNVTEGKIYLPNSLLEGSANTVGSALILSHAGWYSDQMNWHLGRFKSRSLLAEISSEKQAIELMRSIRSYMPEKEGYVESNYALGELVWEYYIAQYGVKAYFDLFTNIQALKDFDQAMQKTIQKSEEEFYADAAPYVMKAYNAVTP